MVKLVVDKLLIFLAHSCLDFEEMSLNITKAFGFCKVVEQLDYFAEFKGTIENMNVLNTAHTTPGADHFGDFRCTVVQLT